MSAPAPARTAEHEALARLLRTTLTELQTVCAEILPSVTLTLTGIIQATEGAAQKTLDATDALGERHTRLASALGRLVAFVPQAGAEPWRNVAEATNEFPGAIHSVIAAMEFQDLTAQHLHATIGVIDSVRQRLTEILASANVRIDDRAAPVKIAPNLAAPAISSPWRQEMADQLIDEARELAPTESRS